MKQNLLLKFASVALFAVIATGCSKKTPPPAPQTPEEQAYQAEVDQVVYDKACEKQFPGMKCSEVMQKYSSQCDALKEKHTEYLNCLVTEHKKSQ